MTEGLKNIRNRGNVSRHQTPPLPCPVALQGVAQPYRRECPQDEGVKTAEELKKHRKQTEYLPPPLCLVVKQNIGEVARSDGGVKKYPQ